MKKDIRINFNSYTCYLQDLEVYLTSINWQAIEAGEILYYSSSSKFATYDFKAFPHDDIIEIDAIPE